VALGANEAKASPFIPTFAATLSSNSQGATANIAVTYSYGLAPDLARSFPASSTVFTPSDPSTPSGPGGPAGFNIPDCSGLSLATQPVANVPGPNPCPYPMGNTTGTASSTTTFGLFSGACAVNIPIFFPGSPSSTGLQNASTDPSDSIAPGAGFADLIDDKDDGSGTYPTFISNGIMDGAEHWNDLLVGLPAPRERQVATANLFGTTIWVDIVTYNPGVVAPAALGYATLVIVENFSPALPATPGLITDVCGTSITLNQNGFAGNGAVHRSNPTAVGTFEGTYIFFLSSQSQRDADNDGYWNSIDTCPFKTNCGSPLVPGQPANGDHIAETAPGDGIDGDGTLGCDAAPTVNNGSDADADTFLNRGDNCPQLANAQSDVGILMSPRKSGS